MSRKKRISLSGLAPILPGRVSTVLARCGKENCKCHTDPSERHGPYHRWMGMIDGHTTTITLSEEEAVECTRRIANYRKLRVKLDAIAKESLRSAPWTDR